jgi:hypothetical protein
MFTIARWIIFVFLLVPATLAIGISPPTAQLDFVPGKTYDFVARLTNYNDVPITVEIRSENSFGAVFSAKQPIEIDAMSTTGVPVYVKLPESLPKPGYHTGYLYFTETFEDDYGGAFSARTEVGLRITVWQPYPGLYAEITASAPSVSHGSDTKLRVYVSNLGTDAIEDGTATVKVVAPSGELKDLFTFTGLNIAGNTGQELFAKIPSKSYLPGRYTLFAKLEYGEKTASMNSTFIVGTQDVDALALEGPFYLDKPVNRFNVHVESLWNLPLDNVYATVQLGSTQAKTPSIRLQPFQRTTLQGYWETDRTVPPGQPAASVVIYFDGGKKETLLPVLVYNETPPLIGAAVEEPTITLSAADLLFIILASAIVLVLVVFAFERYFKHKPQQPSQP